MLNVYVDCKFTNQNDKVLKVAKGDGVCGLPDSCLGNRLQGKATDWLGCTHSRHASQEPLIHFRKESRVKHGGAKMQKEERKYNKVKTTEILDFLAKELDYSNEAECNKQSDYSDELENRKPFKHLKQKIDQLEGRLKGAVDTIQKLIGHKHDKEDGQVVIKIDKAITERYF